MTCSQRGRGSRPGLNVCAKPKREEDNDLQPAELPRGVGLRDGHQRDRNLAVGVPTTSPERSIVDSLEAGTQPEQVELAIRQALNRGLTTPRRLRVAAADRPDRARRFVERILTETTV